MHHYHPWTFKICFSITHFKLTIKYVTFIFRAEVFTQLQHTLSLKCSLYFLNFFFAPSTGHWLLSPGTCQAVWCRCLAREATKVSWKIKLLNRKTKQQELGSLFFVVHYSRQWMSESMIITNSIYNWKLLVNFNNLKGSWVSDKKMYIFWVMVLKTCSLNTKFIFVFRIWL